MAAETAAEAERQFLSRGVWRLGRDRGVYAPLPSPEEAAAMPLSDADATKLERIKARAIYGTGAVVGTKLRALAAEVGVDEIAMLTTLHDPAARQRSYALIAAEFGLGEMLKAA